MKKYSPISVLVESGEKYRVFTTESFSIRPITNHLQRYNPDFKIVMARYGFFPAEIKANNSGWITLTESERANAENMCSNDLIALKGNYGQEKEREWLLESLPYRTALTTWYMYAAQHGIYPQKNPFSGVQVSYVPEEIVKIIGTCEHPTFVADKDNPLERKEDILKWYDGKRIEKYVNGYKAEGYLLEKIRIEIAKNNENN